MLEAFQYYGAGSATVAALVVSLNLGRRWTGYAMILFVSSSLALIIWGFMQPESDGIGWQNVALLIINAIGVWRYLLRPAGWRGSRPASRRRAVGGRLPHLFE